ncbi:MAG: Ig-like domain-containing protein [Prevotella sp.]|nr:Ig-like domain-containing protein [Prevotella sp.]
MKQKIFKFMLLLLVMLVTGSMAIQAKKVHTLGDSTMAPYNEDVTNTRGWGMYFGNFLTNGWTSVNYAKGGRDSRAGYNELWQNAQSNVEEGDYVLIQFAHNDTQYSGMDNLELQAYYQSVGDETNRAAVASDGRGTIPSTTYKACLKQICDAVKAKGATPILVSSVCRCYFTGGVAPITRAGRHDIGGNYKVLTANGPVNGAALPESDHTMDYTYQMQQLAQEEGVQFIDMTAATKSLYESYGTYDKCYAALFDKGSETDNTHYNLTGALTAARLCAQLIKEAGILTDAIEIPTDLALSPSTVDLGEGYLGKTAMKEMTLSGLGLDPAAGTVTLTASEGIMLSTDKQNWQNSLEVDYTNGTLIKTFYARVTLSTAGQYNGTVTATMGENEVNVPVTINVVELGGGDPFTVDWTMNKTDQAAATVSDTELVTATDVTYESLGTYGYVNGFGALIAPTGSTGAWPTAAIDDQNQYVQFAVTAPEGKKLDISSIAMKIKAQGGGSLQCHVYYSTDGFVTRKTIFATSAALTSTWNEISSEDVIKVDEGEQLLIRVYPWSGNVDNGRWICISDVAVAGQSKDAAGVNIEGTISYALDKGGLTQGDDAVFDPETLSACFAGKAWTAGSGINVSGTTNYYGVNNASKTTTTVTNASTTTSLASTASADNTLTLTLTPEEGFSFVPTSVSFKAARYGTDSGNINLVAKAGEGEETLCDNQAVNRGGKGLDIASFDCPIDNLTATADNPLKLEFSFLGLGKTKSMGIADVIISGQVVGAQAQVTKYMLNTQVAPSAEAGSITRSPDMEQYKEGSTVTLTATKNFGYRFVEWQDENNATVSTDAETTVTMDAEKTMKAVFEAVPVYSVTTQVANDAEREGLGNITLTPNEHNGQYEAGTQITAVANESSILKFTNWEDNSTLQAREITVNDNMTITANYEVQDFIAVFDASITSAYATQGSYPFSADVTWDDNRNARVSVVKQSDGSLVTGTNSTPVVRNRAKSGVLSTLSGVFQNGYNTAEIAWQYQFSTVGFTSANFKADMAAKNAATANWKAQISIDGETYTDLGDAWTVTANVQKPLDFTLPETAMGKETVYVRIMGTGTDLLSDKYSFNAGTSEEGLAYATNSEAQIGNVYVLGEAIVEADETAPVVTGRVPDDNATNVSATGKITISFDEKIEAGSDNGIATLTKVGATESVSITPAWSNRSVSFSYSGLEYGASYVFSMPAGYVQDKSGNLYASAENITFTVMERPTVTKAMYDFIVPDDGTITEALAAANSRSDKTVRYRVFIKNSTEPYVFDTNGTTTGGDNVSYPDPRSYLTAANTSFIGESMEGVIITNQTPDADAIGWNNGFGVANPLEGIGKGDVLIIEGAATDSYFQNLTIKTSMGDAHGRDIAVQDKSNRTIFKDAQLWGYQDTYVSNNQNGKFYFEGGVIRGRTDYICGKGDVYFNEVTFRQVASGYLAVPSVPKQYGYILQSCKIIGDTNSGVDGTFTLGRPWGKGTPIALFINTEMEVKPSAIGWSEMSGGYPARFAEYGSHTPLGAAVSTEGRKTTYDAYDSKVGDVYTNRRDEYNNPILSSEEAAVPTLSAVMGQDDDWQPTLHTEQAPVPTNVIISNGTLSWTGSNYALLYAIVKDGSVIDFTTETSYAIDGEGEYAVRAANEMGGLGIASETAVEIEVGTETITIPEDGVATYVTQHALDFTSLNGAFKAYVVTAVSTTSATTEEVTQVPAGTALLLKGAQGSYDVEIAASADAPQTNLLQASDGSVTGAAGNIYAYSKSAKKFKRVGATVTIPTGKCYLEINGSGPVSLDIDFDSEATAVNNINDNANLNVNVPVKVIKNGKLFIGNYNVAGQQGL